MRVDKAAGSFFVCADYENLERSGGKILNSLVEVLRAFLAYFIHMYNMIFRIVMQFPKNTYTHLRLRLAGEGKEIMMMMNNPSRPMMEVEVWTTYIT